MEKKKLLITINTGEKKFTLQAPKGRLLKGLLGDAGIFFSMPCGGAGRCGKCKVRFLGGAPKPNTLDNSFLTVKEIENGYRLLCRCMVTEDCELELDGGASKEEEIEVESSYKTRVKDKMKPEDVTSWGIAIDIGTTTLEAMLVGMNKDKEREIFEIISGINHQRSFGADVIARIAAAGEGHSGELQRIVQEDISRIISDLATNHKVTKLDYICITGNTTMLHLLRGYDVSGLGKYPYKAVNLELEHISASDLLGDLAQKIPQGILDGTRAVLMPGISAFVGADIVSGLYAISITKTKHSTLFLDLGTNGEMAFWDGEKLFVTSTAVGPVFEAGGITCGMPAVPGAICGTHIDKKEDGVEVKLETVKNKEPIGICGTGVFEAVSELVRNKIVDETGLLAEDYFEKGFPLTDGDNGISITQSDIRNVQLGKAALMAAQRELLKGKVPELIEVSGGYSRGFNPENISHLKLFSSEVKWVRSASNAALVGCMYFLVDILTGQEQGEMSVRELEEIAHKAQVVELVNLSDFAENYVDAMNF
jgi:uncharacterized 2Fe-2S/4Fe-4S cluster protein (DUF4445 family)